METLMKEQELLYRYTSNGEGTFSAGRRLLDEQPKEFIDRMVQVVKDNKQWLVLSRIEHDNLEFFWTEKGKEEYEKTFLPMHREYLPNIEITEVKREELLGEIVYEDEHQIGIKAKRDKGHLPNPYRTK